MKKLAQVALHQNVDKVFDYEIPEALSSSIKVGSFVEVPLKSSLKKGTVLGISEISSEEILSRLRPIQRLLDESPQVPEDLLKLAKWMSSYYSTPLAKVLKTILPTCIRDNKKLKEQYVVFRVKTREEIICALVEIRKRSFLQASVLDYLLTITKEIFLTELLEKTGASRQAVCALVKKGLIGTSKVAIESSPLKSEEYFPTKPKILTAEQKQTLDRIEDSLEKNIFQTHLLFGVTGSGKTEVYLQAISKAMSCDKGTIMLVPEISLTTQTIERFRSRFEGHIAILHHRLSEQERKGEWDKIQNGTARIVIGARSAVFSPVQNLGLIIVDEEHESSYKQSDGMPTYHGRDVAVMRGSFCKASVVLGSATPSIESYYNAKTGKYSLSILKGRPEQVTLPRVELVDMRKEMEKHKHVPIFSDTLLSAIEGRFKKGEQTILFLNRRGFHTHMWCTSCEKAIKCSHCDVSLTYHKNLTSLSCHLCGHTLSPPPSTCPQCGKENLLKFRGVGTEQVEAALRAIFPDIRTLRLDADTTKHKGSHQKLFRSFRTGKADILIGTQMLAKGLHFPEVTLVGILNSDTSLSIPDFRSSETTFQLLTQVAGRAGRGSCPGEVIIQTFVPENSTIQKAAKQDYVAFFEEEIATRELFGYPPFSQLVKVRTSSENASLAQEAAESVRVFAERTLTKDYEASLVIPPAHAKIKAHHRFQFIIKGPKVTPIVNALTLFLQTHKIHPDVRILYDINPTSTFF